MPIPGIAQPEILPIDSGLRLRRYDGIHDFAFCWYQDPETVYLVDGVRTPYSRETLAGMYRWLNEHGELYFIEVLEKEQFVPVGDVTFWQQDMPIVIGDSRYRGRGIGSRVIAALIDRGRELGYRSLQVREIYSYNTGSRRCFEKAGFRVSGETESGVSMVLALKGRNHHEVF